MVCYGMRGMVNLGRRKVSLYISVNLVKFADRANVKHFFICLFVS